MSGRRALPFFPEGRAPRLALHAWLHWLGFAAACFAILWSRQLGWTAVPESLWAEDANVFLAHAYTFGPASILMPYQGYFHTFQRFVALLAAAFPLWTVPYTLFACCVLALVALGAVIRDRLEALGLAGGAGVLAAAIVVLQPHAGEVFFSITNTQWVLGLTLAIIVCVPSGTAQGALGKGLVLLCSLTGPFSLLLVPILGLQWVIRRDGPTRRFVYLCVTGCGLLQFAAIASSTRLDGEPALNALRDWTGAAAIFLAFGGVRAWMPVLGLAVVLLPFLSAWRRRRAGRPVPREIAFACYAVLAALGIFGASLVSVSRVSEVDSIGPLSGGARYYFVPYGLLLLALSMMLLRGRGWAWTVLGPLFVALLLAAAARPGAERVDFQWPAYARFAAVWSGVTIPVNPVSPVGPLWQLDAPVTAGPRAQPRPIVPRSGSEPTRRVFDLDGVCRGHRAVAFEFSGTVGGQGLFTLGWSGGRLERRYPPGPATLQFALMRPAEVESFVLTPAGPGSTFVFDAGRVFCL